MTFRICRTRRTGAGITTEIVERDGVGIQLHAKDAETALANARTLFPWLPAGLVAVSESN